MAVGTTTNATSHSSIGATSNHPRQPGRRCGPLISATVAMLACTGEPIGTHGETTGGGPGGRPEIVPSFTFPLLLFLRARSVFQIRDQLVDVSRKILRDGLEQ